jgi:sulfate transport system ATP-binding protein
MTVEIEGLVRRFGSSAALDGVSLSLRAGEFAALLGPSGSGKTTLLRILAGLDFPDAGSVRIEGKDVADVPARLRGVGVVFQHYALFRHMTVAENVAFGLRVRPRRHRPPETEIARRVAELLELVQIPELAQRYPGQVSGGQRQRVALARALAIEPKLLLLDEPFGALDALVRKDVRRWVRGLHDRLGITSILVTHDQEEAMELADRIAVMDRGRVLQFGTPRELLDAPQNAFVAGFVGEANRLAGFLRDGRLEIAGLDIPPQEFRWPDGPVMIFARPEDVIATPSPAAKGSLRVTLVREERAGTRVILQGDGVSLDASLAVAGENVRRGSFCTVRLHGMIAFSADGAHRVPARQVLQSA